MQQKSSSLRQAITVVSPLSKLMQTLAQYGLASRQPNGLRLLSSAVQGHLLCRADSTMAAHGVCQAVHLPALQLPAATCQAFLLQHLIQACCPLRLFKMICKQLHFSSRLSTLRFRTASHPVVQGVAPSPGHKSSPQQHPRAEGPEADLHICLYLFLTRQGQTADL